MFGYFPFKAVILEGGERNFHAALLHTALCNLFRVVADYGWILIFGTAFRNVHNLCFAFPDHMSSLDYALNLDHLD